MVLMAEDGHVSPRASMRSTSVACKGQTGQVNARMADAGSQSLGIVRV